MDTPIVQYVWQTSERQMLAEVEQDREAVTRGLDDRVGRMLRRRELLLDQLAGMASSASTARTASTGG